MIASRRHAASGIDNLACCRKTVCLLEMSNTERCCTKLRPETSGSRNCWYRKWCIEIRRWILILGLVIHLIPLFILKNGSCLEFCSFRRYLCPDSSAGRQASLDCAQLSVTLLNRHPVSKGLRAVRTDWLSRKRSQRKTYFECTTSKRMVYVNREWWFQTLSVFNWKLPHHNKILFCPL